MNWKTHIKLTLPKLSRACHYTGSMKHWSNLTLKMISHAYFHSTVAYGVTFWGNSMDINKVLLLHKEVIRIMMGISPISTRIFTVPL